jgi:hypothetical protein
LIINILYKENNLFQHLLKRASKKVFLGIKKKNPIFAGSKSGKKTRRE